MEVMTKDQILNLFGILLENMETGSLNFTYRDVINYIIGYCGNKAITGKQLGILVDQLNLSPFGTLK